MKVLIANMPAIKEVVVDLLGGKILGNSEDFPNRLEAEIHEDQLEDLREWSGQYHTHVSIVVSAEERRAEGRAARVIWDTEQNEKRERFLARPVVKSGRHSYRLRPGEKLNANEMVEIGFFGDEISIKDYVAKRWRAELRESDQGPSDINTHGLTGILRDDE